MLVCPCVKPVEVAVIVAVPALAPDLYCIVAIPPDAVFVRGRISVPVPESENLLLQDLVNLIQSALDIKMESKMYQRWIKGWDKVVQVHILNEGFVHVLIKDNQMKAAIGKPPREPDIAMEGEYETMTNYLNGELDPILMFFDFILLRKMRLIKGLEIKLSSILSGNLVQQARILYRIDKILKIR